MPTTDSIIRSEGPAPSARQSSVLEDALQKIGRAIKRKPIGLWLSLLILLGFILRLAGLHWGQAYVYFGQGDAVAAYSVAVDYGRGEPRAEYLGQPNYNEKSKLPGPLWAIFCFLGLRFGGSISGVVMGVILLNTAAIYLTYELAKRTLGFPASLWAALLAATSPWTVYYSCGVYNPNVMLFLGGLCALALWDVVQRPRSPKILGVCLLLMVMPQFHMSGLMLIPAVAVILWLSSARVNVPWLLGGFLAGTLLYLPYVRGDSAHGWQNTLGMVSGRDRHSWEGFKALTAPLSFLVNWAPRWTRSAAEYSDLGKACFGSFSVFLAFNLLSAIVAGLLVARMFLKIREAMRGFWRAPRAAFNRAPGILFLAILVVTPILFALVRTQPFHTRYCLVFLPALLGLAGSAVAHWRPAPRIGPLFIGALILTTATNVWLMPAMYHHQGTQIEQADVFIPSFRQLETVYQQLKRDAGERLVEVEDGAYLQALPRNDNLGRDAALIRRYVAIRERESILAASIPKETVSYTLISSDKRAPGQGRIVYAGHGIVVLRTLLAP